MKTVVPPRRDIGPRVGARTLWAVRNVAPQSIALACDPRSKRRARVPRLVGCWLFIGLENAFSPSVVESKHGWRTAMHRRSQRSGEPEWSLRNGGCVAGLPCEDENEGRGNNQKTAAAAQPEWNAVECRVRPRFRTKSK